MRFKVIIQNLDQSQKWTIPFISGNIVEELNRDRSANITFSFEAINSIASNSGITVEQLLTSSYKEMFIYDDDDNLIYSGFIDDYGDSIGENSSGKVNITSRGFFTLLTKRHTDKVKIYSATDSSDIAWDLINESQTSGEEGDDLGITRGLDPTTVNRNRTYYNETISDAIFDLSKDKIKEGFDFEVNNSKQFNVFYPQKGTQRDSIIVKEGFNMLTARINKNGVLNMANQIIVMGSGYGEEMISETRDAEDVYKQIYYLLQDTLPEKDIIEASTLQDKGDRYLEIYKLPRRTVSVTTFFENPNWNDFDVGDTIKVVIPSREIDEFFRIERRSLNLVSNKCNLTFRTY